MPFFSVCIPLYNKGNFISDTLCSVIDQYFKDFEIVICDDGSTDESVKKVQQFDDDRIKLIQQENQGAAIARNQAIQASTGEYIALLDADDLWQKHHLNDLHQLIIDHPQAKLFATNYKIELPNGKERLPFFAGKLRTGIVDDYFLASLSDPVMTCFNSAIHRFVFKEIGYFDPAYRTGQDVDFAIRANLAYRLAYQEEPSVIYHQETENNLAKSKLNEDRLNYIRAYDAQAEMNESLARYLVINRFALIMKSKQADDGIWKEAQKGLKIEHLDLKQRLLVRLNGYQLRMLKRLQQRLMKSGFYFSPFKS